MKGSIARRWLVIEPRVVIKGFLINRTLKSRLTTYKTDLDTKRGKGSIKQGKLKEIGNVSGKLSNDGKWKIIN